MIKNNIRWQLLRNIYLIVIIPLLLLGGTTYFIASSAIREKVIASKLNSLEQLNKNLDTEVQKIHKYFDLVFTNSRVTELLRTSDFSSYGVARYQVNQELTAAFTSIFNNDTRLVSAGIFTQESDLVFSYKGGPAFSDTGTTARSSWFQDTWTQDGAVRTLGSGRNQDVLSTIPWVYSTSRLLKDVTYRKDLSPLGVLYMSFDESVFSDIFQQVDTSQSGSILIADPQGAVISASDKNSLGSSILSREDLPGVFAGKSGWFVAYPEGKKSLVTYYTSALSGWKVIEITPYSYLLSDVSQIGMLTLLLGAVSLVVLYFVSYAVAVRWSSPIKDIRNAMQKVAQGRLETRVQLQTHTSDEIGQIADSFNHMVLQLSQLFDTVREQERRNRDIEIRMLQYQINPHFLYNTLSSINLTAMMKDYDGIQATTQALGRLLRNVLGKAGSMIPLNAELENVKDFITIMNIRYNHAIELRTDVPDDLLPCPVPNLLLQPLVENAVFHGQDPRAGPLIIEICASADRDSLGVSVADNGTGMTPERLAEVMEGSAAGKHQLSGIGLKNVDERLKLNFGVTFGITLHSIPGKGTTVHIRLPLEGENHTHV